MPLPRYVTIHKKRGQTPLAALEAWRATSPAFAQLPVTYAGRLDPMAEGKLLLLLGEECKRREKYLGLDKEYVVEVLLGASTDTGDTLGMPMFGVPTELPEAKELRGALQGLIGNTELPYPSFSSKTVGGRPLFEYALKGTLSSITIPTHTETVYDIALLGTETLSHKSFSERVSQDLALAPRTGDPEKQLGADFRQDAIRAAWEQALTQDKRDWPIIRVRVTCASGTYMRTLAARLGEMLGAPALALSITRTRIGRYRAFGPIGFWSKSF